MTLVYNKNYYLSNKKRFLEWQKEYRLKNKEKVQKHRVDYQNKPEIRSRRALLRKRLRIIKRKEYLEKRKKDDKKYYLKTRERQLIYKRNHGKEYYQKNKEKIRIWQKKHSQLPEIKARRAELARIRRRNNPQSNRSIPLDLQFVMNQVRIRDKNTCQWQGCGLTFKQSPIHVHHIFPRSEYPELEHIEKYMICYCANHHGMFHRYRGDHYSEMIKPRYQELRGSD